MALILSPHLDDATLSCWHLLAGSDEVEVVNVFTGIPPDGALGHWDRETGATGGPTRVKERLEEDRAALAVAGRTAVGLGLLDAQYRNNGRGPDVLGALLPRLAPDAVLYAPAALGVHVDHALVREAALALRQRGHEIRLYADLPHALAVGWPAWVTGRPPASSPSAPPEEHWRRALEGSGVRLEELRAEVHELAPEEFERKLEALRAYRTQLPALERLAPLELLRHEVVWTEGR
jgi:LmbE family N-acetylglucosaminyl deacetylase